MKNKNKLQIGDIVKNKQNNEIGIILFFTKPQLFEYTETDSICTAAFTSHKYPVWLKDLELIYREFNT